MLFVYCFVETKTSFRCVVCLLICTLIRVVSIVLCLTTPLSFPNMKWMTPTRHKPQTGQLWQNISVSDSRIDLPHAQRRRHETCPERVFTHYLEQCLRKVIPLLHEVREAKK